MPTLTNLDRLEILTRNAQFIRDLEYVQKFSAPSRERLPFLLEDLPKTQLRRRGRFFEEVREPTKREMIRARIMAAGVNPGASLKRLRERMEEVKHGKRRDASLIQAVRPIIKYDTVRGNGGEPDIIRSLRDERFLTLEIDLLAANTKNLTKEVGEYLAEFRSTIRKEERTRKHHASTSDIDPWAVYDACHGKSGTTLWKFAKEIFRERRGGVAGFTSQSKEYKAARRALKIATDLMTRLPYPLR